LRGGVRAMENIKMLFTILLSLPLLSVSASSEAQSRLSAVTQMEILYKDIDPEGQLVDHGYWIGFLTEPALIQEFLNEAEKCQAKGAFRPVEVGKLASLVESYAAQAIERIYIEGSIRQTELTARLKAARLLLEKDLRSSNLEMCTDVSAPAYSDGHVTHFVKRDGILAFIFEQGFPD
jgi:hypothetical protein